MFNHIGHHCIQLGGRESGQLHQHSGDRPVIGDHFEDPPPQLTPGLEHPGLEFQPVRRVDHMPVRFFRELIEPVEAGYRFQVELIRRWFAAQSERSFFQDEGHET